MYCITLVQLISTWLLIGIRIEKYNIFRVNNYMFYQTFKMSPFSYLHNFWKRFIFLHLHKHFLCIFRNLIHLNYLWVCLHSKRMFRKYTHTYHRDNIFCFAYVKDKFLNFSFLFKMHKYWNSGCWNFKYLTLNGCKVCLLSQKFSLLVM